MILISCSRPQETHVKQLCSWGVPAWCQADRYVHQGRTGCSLLKWRFTQKLLFSTFIARLRSVISKHSCSCSNHLWMEKLPLDGRTQWPPTQITGLWMTLWSHQMVPFSQMVRRHFHSASSCSGLFISWVEFLPCKKTLIHFSENVTEAWIHCVVSSEQVMSYFCLFHPNIRLYKEADWAESHRCTCVTVLAFLFVPLFQTIGGGAIKGVGCLLPLPLLYTHFSLRPIYTAPL